MIVVTVWRRHSAKCPHRRNRGYRKCQRRIWLEWGAERNRKSAKTRSWEQGEKIARAMERDFERAALGQTSELEAVTVEHATNSFLDAKKGEGLDHDTIEKHEHMTTQTNKVLLRDFDGNPIRTAHLDFHEYTKGKGKFWSRLSVNFSGP